MSDTAHLELAIDVESDPISGSVSGASREERRFTGWIELVAAIESARRDEKTLGLVPGAKPVPA
jgi:hypothetical protein